MFIIQQKPKKYSCPKCGFSTNYTRTYEKHLRLPENRLPVGLVFKWDSFKHPSVIVKRAGYKESEMIDDYDRAYHDVRYGFVFSKHPIMNGNLFGITAEQFLDAISFRTIKLYSQEDFERLKEKLNPIAEKHNISLLRTNKRLESILFQ